ncbi:MGH1-like glycoside hydrolase domain-containing protein [Devosia sp.]|uniref:MGH1-like glycoside hydrolase domain-containing protein n=1 Tax=Devosia sp. TaxID=1871048 RepID=UPI003F70F68E
MSTRSALAAKAIEVLRENDRGSYTVPTKGLYPFQWNWDSCFTALGQSHYDMDRAWTEVETLFAHQWADGMVPHMVFHEPAPTYFPGPDVWGTGRTPPTSGITQLPIAGFAIHQLFRRNPDAGRARPLLDGLDRWHGWFYRTRDPGRTGLVAVIHPWESRDNTIDWDEAFERVPTDGVMPYERNDLKHADPATRPTKAQYDRYLWLVQHFRSLGWDSTLTHDASPFQVVDPGFNAILIRSCLETAALADALDAPDIAARHRNWAEQGLVALDGLWSDRHGQYLPFDRVGGRLSESPSIGGLIPVFAPIPAPRAAALASTIGSMGTEVRYLVPSHAPSDPRFDLKRYWRGPVWLVCNYMIADGLGRAGEVAMAERLTADSLQLIEQSGFAEYYDPRDGTPLGGGRFSWTAAMVLEFLEPGPEAGA